MPSAILLRLYAGDRAGALTLASAATELDVFEAAALGDLDALRACCTADPTRVNAVSDDRWTPLHLAAYFGSAACVADLLLRGATVDAVAENGLGLTPLHSACAGDHTEAALRLIAAGADVNARGATGHRPLDSAKRSANAELIAALVAAGGIDGTPDPQGP
jgi:ankyrin repeat protein